jgi:hypothetical protein
MSMTLDNIKPNSYKGRDWSKLLATLVFKYIRQTNHTELYEHPEYGRIGITIDRGSNFAPRTNRNFLSELRRIMRSPQHG